MKKTFLLVACGLSLALVNGCAGNRAYVWGNYDDALYKHYKNPQSREEFVDNLKEIIAEAEKSGGRVPPGICAEFGYCLLEEGRTDEAIAYFRKESELWPESRVIMDKMIRVGSRKKENAPKAPRAPDTPKAAAEGGGK